MKPSASIAAIVINDMRTRHSVRPNNLARRAGPMPSISPEMMPAINRLVPVADSQLNTNTASSDFGADTTGGARKIA